MKEYNTSPQKKKQKTSGLFFIFEILSETAMIMLSRLKGWSELRSCSPMSRTTGACTEERSQMQPKEGSADEVSDRQ